MTKKLDLLLICLSTLIVVLGAQKGTIVTPILLIASIIILCIFVAFNRISSGHYPYIIFGVTLGLMYSASMVGAHVIGSDMHQEYYVSSVVGAWGWHPTGDYGTQSSTSFVVGWFAPFISWLFHIPLVWVYKAVLPFIFSFTPVILYFAFKKQITPIQAFLAVMFFVVVPVATLEIVQIGKSMVAELFFALMILAMVSNIKYKWAVVLSCLLVAALAHYTVGLIAVSYLAVILIVRICTLPLPFQIFKRCLVPISALLIVLIIGVGITFAYYSQADDGIIIDTVMDTGTSYSKITKETLEGVAAGKVTTETIDENTPGWIGDGTTTSVTVSGIKTSDTNKFYDTRFGYLEEQAPLVKTAIGMDFAEASIEGKVFRVIQYITQVMICIGALYLLFRYKKYKFSAEFIAAIGASFVLLLFVVFVPHFSNIINVTRFYHLSLFFLAPLFVIGGAFIFRNIKVVVLVLVVYFVFTSGLVFEISKSETIDHIDVPYSVALSAERTGVTGTYSENDVKAAEWIRDHGDESYKVIGDYNGYRLMMGYIRIFPRLRFEQEPQQTLDVAPAVNAYILVTEWNTHKQKFITDVRGVWEGSGLRQSRPLPEFDYPIVFQSGDAIVYECKIST